MSSLCAKGGSHIINTHKTKQTDKQGQRQTNARTRANERTHEKQRTDERTPKAMAGHDGNGYGSPSNATNAMPYSSIQSYSYECVNACIISEACWDWGGVTPHSGKRDDIREYHPAQKRARSHDALTTKGIRTISLSQCTVVVRVIAPPCDRFLDDS